MEIVMRAGKVSGRLSIAGICLMLSGMFLLQGCKEDLQLPVIPAPEPVPTTIAECFDGDGITISNVWDVPEGVVFNKVKVKISGCGWDTIDNLEAPDEEGVILIPLPSGFSADELMKAGRNKPVAPDYEPDNTGFWPAAIDNANAKVAQLQDILAYNDDRKVGRIYLTDWLGTGTTVRKHFVYFHYADQDFGLSGYNFTIGGNSKSYKYEASFKTGWNAYATIPQSEGGLSLCTTSIPEDIKLYWCFESYVY